MATPNVYIEEFCYASRHSGFLATIGPKRKCLISCGYRMDGFHVFDYPADESFRARTISDLTSQIARFDSQAPGHSAAARELLDWAQRESETLSPERGLRQREISA